MALLEVQNLSYRFPGGYWALKGVTFSVDPGELLIISGKNGSGKTVLLRCLKGLYRSTEGSIRLNGKPFTKNERNTFGLVFQDPDSQIIGQTVEKDISFGLENIDLPPDEVREKAASVLESLDLTGHAKQHPRSLSGGEKRRLTIAGVLAMDPLILALDEPFANLDYPGVIQVLEKIVMLKEAGHTILLVTHELDKVLAHADRLLLLDQGHIAAVGEPTSVVHLGESCGVRIPYRQVPVEDMTWLKE